MKGFIATASLTLLLAAFTAQALTPTPIDAQPYGPVAASSIPAAAATCKAALDAAAKALTASNGDFTTVAQPTGATAANNEYLYCYTAPESGPDVGSETLTLFPVPDLQGKRLTQLLGSTTYAQVPSFMSNVLNIAQQLTNGQYAVTYYNWDLSKPATLSVSTIKYDLIEKIVVGANNYACGCGYKLANFGATGV